MSRLIMELQKIILPDSNICTEEELYYRCNRSQMKYLCAKGACLLNTNETLCFNTYFNSFSIGKWRKYTNLSNLKLKLKINGKSVVTLHHVCKINNEIIQSKLAFHSIDNLDSDELVMEFPLSETIGIYYFSIDALENDVKFYGGEYFTDVAQEINEVNIAIDICTFQREFYLENNLMLLKKSILDNPTSPMHNHLIVFVSDNGKTIDIDRWEDSKIHIYHNKNVGGAGGFTRCILEINKCRKHCDISHVLMMDDDITLDPAVVVRTFNFLRLLKDNYSDAFIGGGMLSLNQKYMQRESADHYNQVRHHSVKPNYDLRKLNFLLKNEIEDSINYFSWWYCCMPANIVSDTNLPLPIFIKRDDIEYGLRNGKCFITLNGIGVWHEAFEFKRSSYLEYYYMRNTCILNAIHRPNFGKKQIRKLLFKSIIIDILQYRYSDANLKMIGVEDFCKGIDWLKSQDGELLNQLIMKCAYQKKPIDQLNYIFIHGIAERNIKLKSPPVLSKMKKFMLNGWLFPAKGTQIVPAVKPAFQLFYRKKRIINYEDISGLAFETFKSYRLLIRTFAKFLKTFRIIGKRYAVAQKEYSQRLHEITNKDFWEQYLFKTGVVDKNGKEPLIEFVPSAKRRWKGICELIKAYMLRAIQYAVFFIPIKCNRVFIYPYNRRGNSCSPKYVMEYLLEQYGDQLEIVFASDFPNSCHEVRKKGVSIISSKSYKFYWYCFTSKVTITNDSLPETLIKRRLQLAINTWHGGINYKHIGLKYLAPRTWAERKVYHLRNKQPDIYISGSEAFKKDTTESFNFDRSVFHSCGLPRNDVFFKDNKSVTAKVKKHYHIPRDTKIVLFAPTFRRGMKNSTFGINFLKLEKALQKRFDGKWVIMFRSHYFINRPICLGSVIDASKYHDMQELLCAADVLISDYSSCMWDYTFTGKPCFVFANDLDNYTKNDRDLAIPIAQWPYPIAQSNESLYQNIINFDQQAYNEKVNAHHLEMGACENGTASHYIGEIVADACLKRKK